MKTRLDTPRVGAPAPAEATAPLGGDPARGEWARPDAPPARDASTRRMDPAQARREAGQSRRDRAVFERMRAGEISAQEGLRKVAMSGGWPIRTERGFIFAAHGQHGDLAIATDAHGWQPVRMQRQGDLLFAEVEMPTDRTQRYKFVSEGGDWAADPLARRYNYDDHGEYSLTRSPGAHLERHLELGGHGLPPRTVRVWVPPEPPTHTLYVSDGQNLFDPEAMWGGWRLQHAAGPSTLIVGIDHGPDRMFELTPTHDVQDGQPLGGGGDRYADLVHQTIRPKMEREYGRTGKVGIMGSSLGGLAALNVAWKHPDGYDFVASLSGTLAFGRMLEGNGETIMDRYAQRLPAKPIIYLDSGGGPEKGDNYAPTREMADLLAASGLAWNDRLFHWFEAGAPHNERAWSSRVGRPLRLFERL